MKRILFILASLLAIATTTSAQFRASEKMEKIGRYNNGAVVLAKLTSGGSSTYYLVLDDVAFANTSRHNYLDPVKLGNKKQALSFLNNLLLTFPEMKSGDVFTNLGLPDGQKGSCGSTLGEKYFLIECDRLGRCGRIYKFFLKKMIRDLEAD